MTDTRPILKGLPEHLRPIADVTGDHPFWTMRRIVSQVLARCGHLDAAVEFRYLAEHECDGDSGMLFTLALNYIRVPGQEPTDA